MKRSVTTLLALAVGYITFFGAVFFSVTSEASIKPVGTFVPMACGAAIQPQNSPIVSNVCMGRLAGEISQSAMGAFEFRDETGASAIYRVTEVSNLLVKLMSGDVRSQVFMVGPNGDEISMKIIRTKDGLLKNAAGKIGDATFEVPLFSPVMTL